MQKITIFILAISLTIFNTQISAKETLLQSIENIEEYSSHDGNYFKLVQLDQGCRIDARFYLSNQNHLYHYFFTYGKLYKASHKIFKYHYKKGEKGSLLHVTDIYQDASHVLKLDDSQVQQDFKNYKALFPSTYLNRCI
ncbi:hypothetical protein [Acinetobacter piscicola]|uniref:hypothetical protein n=1 Tax=Acinetobacter piscicola TaxID=2006115 RepID=UPI000B7CACFA|nr:hypothetical protein [Acinetobacter piscicola]